MSGHKAAPRSLLTTIVSWPAGWCRTRGAALIGGGQGVRSVDAADDIRNFWGLDENPWFLLLAGGCCSTFAAVALVVVLILIGRMSRRDGGEK
jgi:hypothetical protein